MNSPVFAQIDPNGCREIPGLETGVQIFYDYANGTVGYILLIIGLVFLVGSMLSSKVRGKIAGNIGGPILIALIIPAFIVIMIALGISAGCGGGGGTVVEEGMAIIGALS